MLFRLRSPRLPTSADDQRSIRELIAVQQFHRRDAQSQNLRQGRVSDGTDARDGSESSPFRVSPFGDPFSLLVQVIDYIDKLWSFLDAKQFALIHQDGDKLKFVEARFGAEHDTTIWV